MPIIKRVDIAVVSRESQMKTVAIIVAAGSGRRMGGSCKALLEVDAKPLLCHSLELFDKEKEIDGICVAVEASRLTFFEKQFAKRYPCAKLMAWVAGGERRQDSVAAALKAVPPGANLIAVHDVARPFASGVLLKRLLYAAREHGAAIPGIEAVDTIKEVDADGAVVRTIRRETVRAIQTPQIFAADVLREAYRHAAEKGIAATDDASLVEQIGQRVVVVEGERGNRKITTEEDLKTVESLKLKAKSKK